MSDWIQACEQATCLQGFVSAAGLWHRKCHLLVLQMGNEMSEDMHRPFGLKQQLLPALAWHGEEARTEVRGTPHQVNTMHRQALQSQ